MTGKLDILGLLFLVTIAIPGFVQGADNADIYLNMNINCGSSGDNHGFETPCFDWIPETYTGMKAVGNLARTNDIVHGGSFSLKLNCTLDCSSSNSVGVAKLALDEPQNLFGKELSCYVFLPSGSGGPGAHPNGLTLYLKAGPGWTWKETPWKNINYLTNHWWRLSCSLFSNWATEIHEIGIKYSGSGTCDPLNYYSGPIYVDDITWDKEAEYKWTKRTGGINSECGYGIITDPYGNIYSTGMFQDTVNFAEDWGGSDIKSCAGGSDIFVQKLNADGTYAWTRKIGDSAADVGYSLVSDPGGNIYVTGYFGGTVNFAADWGGSDNKSFTGNYAIFITKINADGSYGWTRQIGSSLTNLGRGITSDDSGNIYVGGNFEGTVNFAADWGGTDNKTSAGRFDMSVTRINADGSYGWTKIMGGSGADNLYSIKADHAGNLYLTGKFSGTFNFASDWGGSDNKTSSGTGDIFVTKINSDSSYGWTKRMGGSMDADSGFCITTDNIGNIYVTGQFLQGAGLDINFAEDWGGSDIKSSPMSVYNGFLTKINWDGSYGWTKRIGEPNQYGGPIGYCITTDSAGNIYVGGIIYYKSNMPDNTVNLAVDWGGTDIKVSSGYNDIFIMKVNSDGSYGSARLAGGSAGHDGSYGITVDGNYVYATGYFYGNVNFAADWGGMDGKTSAGVYDYFVLKVKL